MAEKKKQQLQFAEDGGTTTASQEAIERAVRVIKDAMSANPKTANAMKGQSDKKKATS